ncbi:hypothetical protein [Nocardia asiatica]|uniref:hypothetical protein n=1 Tax=Nocardia asiatica TaxID=209252 RepID=UPI002453CA2E|nr:hypothetical protein [Nocardia asiatica]
MTVLDDREPLIPDRGEPPISRKEYRITYRDDLGHTFQVNADEISYMHWRRQLENAGYDVVTQRRRVDISAWEIEA